MDVGNQTQVLFESYCAVMLTLGPSLQSNSARFLIRFLGIFISGREDSLVCCGISPSGTWLENAPSHPKAAFPSSWSFPVACTCAQVRIPADTGFPSTRCRVEKAAVRFKWSFERGK